MSVATMCPHCETKFSLSDGLVGKRVRCKKCNAVFEVVESVTEADSGPAGVRSGPAPSKPAHPAPAAPRPKVRREDFDFDGDERIRHRSSGSNTGLVIGLSVGGGVFLLAIIGLLVWAFLPSKSDPEPPPVAVNNPLEFPFQNLPRDIPNFPRDIPNLPRDFPNPFVKPPDDGLPANADPITRAVAGLKSADVFAQSRASQDLERTKVEEGRRAEVLAGLKGVIDNHRPLVPRREAVKALGFWATRADTRYLIDLLDDTDHGVKEEALYALAKVKDPGAAEAIVAAFPQHRDQAREALLAIGPAAEPAVRTLLDSQDQGVRSEACRILKKIGTAASHLALVQIAEQEEGEVADAARDVLPPKLRPPVWGDRVKVKICVVNGGQFPQVWPAVEMRFKALADSPRPKLKVNTSGDCKWVELAPVNSDAETFARKINFGKVTAVHNNQRLIYVELR